MKTKVYLNVTELGSLIVSVLKGEHIEVLFDLCKFSEEKYFEKVMRIKDGDRMIHYYFENMSILDYQELIRYFNKINVFELDKYELIFV